MKNSSEDIIDVNPKNILEKIDSWLDGFFTLLPNIAIALVLFIVAILLAKFTASLIKKSGLKHNRPSLAEVGSSLVKWTIILIGGMLAITIIAPSVKPGDLIAGLGVGSVAIGFAFKDILQNMLAGILILIRQPFEVGDQIVSGGHEGTVEKIETRATLIKTYDGRRIVIPNADIYTNPVVVKTAFPHIRSQYDIGIGCNDSWEDAKRLMIDAASEIENVLDDPAPEVISVELGDFSNIIRLRWWTKSDRSTVIHTFGEVIENTYKKLDKAGIDMPYPTQVTLWHDQTEEVDGIRGKQREGWPTDGNDPKTAKIANKGKDD